MEVSICNIQTGQGSNRQVNTSLTRTKVISSLSLDFTRTSGIIKHFLQAGHQCDNNLDIIHRDVAKKPLRIYWRDLIPSRH